MDQTRFMVRFKDGRMANQDTEWVEPLDQLVSSAGVQMGWIDLQSPYAVDLEDIQSKFGFHPHAIEDCRTFDQRAKLEQFKVGGDRDHWFWVFHGSSLSEKGDVEFSELHAFLTPQWLVTVHQGKIEPLDLLATQWLARSASSSSTVAGAWAALMDALVEQHARTLSALSEKLEALDDEIISRLSQGQIDRIHHLKMNFKSLRRLMAPQVEYLRAVSDGRMALSTLPEELLDFRAVKDHAQLLVEKLDLAVEATLSLRDSYAVSASLASNRMMGRLTAFSTVFLPLQFVTGFFGMNFGGLPFTSSAWLYAVVAFSLVAPLAVLVWIRRSRF